MKKYKKIVSWLLAASVVFTVGCSPIGPVGIAPDYSDATYQFEFYDYGGPTDGAYNEYGVNYHTGEDYRTVERFKEYKDSGMTLYFPQIYAAYGGVTSWENSEAKRVIDTAAEAGLDRTILNDWRIYRISEVAGGIVGEGKKFATEAELDAFLEDCLDDYIYDEHIYGVTLGDEPPYGALKAYGETYRSIERVAKKLRPDGEFFIHTNLIGCFNSTNAPVWYGEARVDTTGMSPIDIIYARYANYIETYFEETAASYVQCDMYPLNEGSIDDTFVRGLRTVADVCKKLDKDFWFINQAMALQTPERTQRFMTEADARWVNNLAIGFGVRGLGYYTYWRRADNNEREYIHDYSSFISQYGEKCDLYYSMQKIMAEEQKLAPTILSCRYNASAVYRIIPSLTLTNYCSGFKNDEFVALKQVTINKECALVTELYDENKGNYLYMVQNLVDPLNSGRNVYQMTTLKFDDKYKSAVVWYHGEPKLVSLKNSILSVKLQPGDAAFIMPY